MGQIAVGVELLVPSTGQRFILTGRVAAIAAILAAHAERLNGFEFGKVTVDCTPNKTHVSLSESVGVVKIGEADLTRPAEQDRRSPPADAVVDGSRVGHATRRN